MKKYIKPLTSITLIGYFLILLNSCNTSTEDDYLYSYDSKNVIISINDSIYIIDDNLKIINTGIRGRADGFKSGLARFQNYETNGFGYLNIKGEVVIKPVYTSATIFSEGLAWVKNEDKTISLINTSGEILKNIDNDISVKAFSDGLAAMRYDKGNWGFVNKSAEFEIEMQYLDVLPFSDGLAAVKLQRKGNWAFIDKKGNVVIPEKFDYVAPFRFGKAIVSIGNKYGIIDKKGEFIIPPKYDDIQFIEESNLFLVNVKGDYFWINDKDEVKANKIYKRVLPFHGNEFTSVIEGSGKEFASEAVTTEDVADGKTDEEDQENSFVIINKKGEIVIDKNNVFGNFFVLNNKTIIRVDKSMNSFEIADYKSNVIKKFNTAKLDGFFLWDYNKYFNFFGRNESGYGIKINN
jgi:hypothetical protein